MATENLNIYFCKKLKRPIKIAASGTLILLTIYIVICIFEFSNQINTSKDRNSLFILNRSAIQNNHKLLDDRFENLFWFIQISDTHFNTHNDHNRASDLQHFCRHLVPAVNPSVLLHTGDITDSRTPDPMGSDQYVQEWLAYNETRFKCVNDNPNVTWLDIRGNHDNANVYKSWNDYYKNVTVQGSITKEGRSYRYEVKSQDGKRYSFIGVDACLIPGIKRPFNFIGKLESDELDRLKRFKHESENSSYTVWFGHYPTSAISNANDLQSLINGPYLCGHYHNFYGLVPQMYSTQRQGYLEAELGDWKDRRLFRIGVIDGALFTFSDFIYNPHKKNQSPLIVITNPRSILHQMESYEPFWRASQSTHIRVLVFSKLPLAHVNACITKNLQNVKTGSDCLETMELKHVKGPLWVAPWSAKLYRKGLNYITITASNQHESSEQTSPFSFDQKKPQYSFLARVTLRVSFQTHNLYFFCTSLAFALIPLIIFKIFTKSDSYTFQHMLNLSRRSFLRRISFKLYVLVNVDKLFYPLIIVPIYIFTGPLFIGKFVSDHIGVMFAWGAYIDGHLLPVAFTYFYSGIFIFIFHIPFIGSLACLVCSRFMKIISKDHELSNCDIATNDDNSLLKDNFCNKLNIFLLVCIIILEAFASTFVYLAYGYLAMFTNVFAWLSFLYLVLLVIALRLKKEDFARDKETFRH